MPLCLKQKKHRSKIVLVNQNLNNLINNAFDALSVLKEYSVGKGINVKYKNKTIKPRSNGNGYFTRYRDSNGQHAIYGSTPQEVKKKLNKALKEKNEPKKTFGWWFETWINLYKTDNVRSSTIKSYNSIYKNYLSRFNNFDLKNFDVLELFKYIKGIKSSRQAQKVYDTLKSCLDAAVNFGYITSNPVKLILRPKHIKVQKHSLTEKQVIAFIDACYKLPQRDAALMFVCLFEGLRKSEAIALTRADLDFNAKTISVNKIIGATVEDVGETKTEAGNRNVPMFKNVETTLLQFINLKPNERLFPIGRAQIDRIFHKVLKLTGIESGSVTLHCLRRTCATMWFEIGVPTKQIQYWLGHADESTTKNIYIKIRPDFNSQNVELVNKHLFDTQIDTHFLKAK